LSSVSKSVVSKQGRPHATLKLCRLDLTMLLAPNEMLAARFRNRSLARLPSAPLLHVGVLQVASMAASTTTPSPTSLAVPRLAGTKFADELRQAAKAVRLASQLCQVTRLPLLLPRYQMRVVAHHSHAIKCNICGGVGRGLLTLQAPCCAARRHSSRLSMLVA
jgi:hypothetical protein